MGLDFVEFFFIFKFILVTDLTEVNQDRRCFNRILDILKILQTFPVSGISVDPSYHTKLWDSREAQGPLDCLTHGCRQLISTLLNYIWSYIQIMYI